jgi:hypothetical protein
MESLQEINPEKTKLVMLKSCSCVYMLGTYVDCYQSLAIELLPMPVTLLM